MELLSALSVFVAALLSVLALALSLDRRGERKAERAARGLLAERMDLLREDHATLKGRVDIIGGKVDEHDRAIPGSWRSMGAGTTVPARGLPPRPAPVALLPRLTSRPGPRMRADVRAARYPSRRVVTFTAADGREHTFIADARDVDEREGTVRVDVRGITDAQARVSFPIAPLSAEEDTWVPSALILDLGMAPAPALPIGEPTAPGEVEQIERSLAALRELADRVPGDPAPRDLVARWEAMLRDAKERAGRSAMLPGDDVHVARPASPEVTAALAPGAPSALVGLSVDDADAADVARSGELAAEQEAPGRESGAQTVSLETRARLTDEDIARIDRLAEAHGVTRETMIGRLAKLGAEAETERAGREPAPTTPPGGPANDDDDGPPSGKRPR